MQAQHVREGVRIGGRKSGPQGVAVTSEKEDARLIGGIEYRLCMSINIRRHRRELGKAQLLLELEGRDGKTVRGGLSQQLAVVEQPGTGIREVRVEDRAVMTSHGLVKDRWGNAQRFCWREDRACTQCPARRPIGFTVDRRTGKWIDAIDVGGFDEGVWPVADIQDGIIFALAQ